MSETTVVGFALSDVVSLGGNAAALKLAVQGGFQIEV